MPLVPMSAELQQTGLVCWLLVSIEMSCDSAIKFFSLILDPAPFANSQNASTSYKLALECTAHVSIGSVRMGSSPACKIINQ